MQCTEELKLFRNDHAEHARLSSIASSHQRSWSSDSAVAEVLRQLECFGDGAALAECQELRALLTNHSNMRAFVNGWVRSITRMLDAEPLAQPQIAHHRSRTSSIAHIASCNGAELSLVCHDVEVESAAPPTTVHFHDIEMHEAIVSGSAEAVLVMREGYQTGSSLKRVSKVLRRGDLISQYDGLQTRLLTHVHEPLVLLRLTRSKATQGPTQQINIEDGTLQSQSSMDKRSSCHEVMMAVLGRMGRKDAVPAMAMRAREGSEHLRWEAIRQCLSLDVEQGFALLCEVAAAPGDPLASHAGALRAQLIESHPQLANLERVTCLV